MKQAIMTMIKLMRAYNEEELSENVYHIRRLILLQMESSLTLDESSEALQALRVAQNNERIRLAEDKLKWEE